MFIFGIFNCSWVHGAVSDGNRLVYNVGTAEVTELTVGNTVTDSQEFKSAITEIPVRASKYVTVYEINGSKQIVRYVSRKIVTAEIQYFDFETSTGA